MIDITTKLLRLAMMLEAKELHAEVAKIPEIIREINAANKDSEVEISSWADFLGWWNNNRGQTLNYTFIDTYGENSEEAKEVQKLMQESNALEDHLHAFYMKLRRKAQQPQEPAQTEAPAPVEEDLSTEE